MLLNSLIANNDGDTLNFYEQATAQNLPSSAGTFGTYFSQVLQGVFAISALLVLIYLIWGGIDWISSGGDKSKTEKARDKITQAVIGLVVLASAFAIFSLIEGFLNINLISIDNS